MNARSTGQDRSDRRSHDRASPSYEPRVVDIRWSAAVFADKIVKGAKPADMPGEEPIIFELAVNLKTVKALGLTIPPPILLRADQVIE